MSQTDQAQEFKTDNVTVRVTRKPGCQVTLDIVVTPKGTEAAYLQAIKNVKKEISLPGFRKGKAPDALVLQNYKSYIDQELRDCVIQTAFREATKEANVYPLNEKSLKRPQLKSCSKEGGAHVVIEFESAPEVPTINVGELELKQVAKAPVTESDIDRTLEEIRHHHATWDDVVDRPAQKDDFVDLTIDALEEPPHQICEETRFELKKGEIADWMLKLIVGMNVGESVEGLSEKQAEDHVHTEHCQHESHAEFKPTHCKITLKAIKKQTLPEVDDELAKKIGLTAATEIRERLRANLESKAEQNVKEKLRNQLEDVLAERYDFDVPASLIEEDYKARLNSKLAGLRKKDVSDEAIAARKQEIEAEVLRDVRKRWQFLFLSKEIASANKIGVTQNELLQELSKQMWMTPPEERIIDSATMEPDEIRDRLYFVIMAQKVKDHLVQQAKII